MLFFSILSLLENAKQTTNKNKTNNNMNHIAQDWPRKRMTFVLEGNLMKDKFIRDAWLNWTTEAAMKCKTPLAKNMPHTRAFQRKVAVWRYNQHGIWDREMWQLPSNCHITGQRGIPGTRNWVPHLNITNWTMSYWTNQGFIMAHRVKPRGYGTDPHLRRGQWDYRFYKSYERNYKHVTRA